MKSPTATAHQRKLLKIMNEESHTLGRSAEFATQRVMDLWVSYETNLIAYLLSVSIRSRNDVIGAEVHLKRLIARLTDQILGALDDEMRSMTRHTASRTIEAIRGAKKLTLNEVSSAELEGLAASQVFEGKTPKDWIEAILALHAKRLVAAVRIAGVRHTPNEVMVNEVRGMPEFKFKDGLLHRPELHLRTVISTFLHQSMNNGRYRTMEANADILGGWLYKAESGGTSTICSGLDGEIFPIGKGPRAPLHFGCRSYPVPVMKDGSKVILH